jgi:hypothetical protein
MFHKIISGFAVLSFAIMVTLHTIAMFRNFELGRTPYAFINLFFIFYCGMFIIINMRKLFRKELANS